MTTSLLRRAARAVFLTTATAGLLVLGTGIASAHVTIDASTTAAGAYSLLTLSVPHGCDGSATTSVAIKMPESITSVTPTVNPGWTIDVQMVNLADPVDDGHGGQITERPDQVVYTALTPLPDDRRDAFELSVKLPDLPGETLAFPAVQTCEQGEAAWIETAQDGQDEPAHPAPQIVITDAAAGGHGAPEAGTESGPSTVSWVALGAGVLALLVASGALIRRPRVAADS